MCFYYYTNNTDNTNNTNTNVSSRYFSKKTSEKRPPKKDRRISNAVQKSCVFSSIRQPLTRNMLSRPCLPPLKLNKNMRA